MIIIDKKKTLCYIKDLDSLLSDCKEPDQIQRLRYIYQRTVAHTLPLNEFYERVGELGGNTQELSTEEMIELLETECEEAHSELLNECDDFFYFVRGLWRSLGDLELVLENVEGLQTTHKFLNSNDWESHKSDYYARNDIEYMFAMIAQAKQLTSEYDGNIEMWNNFAQTTRTVPKPSYQRSALALQEKRGVLSTPAGLAWVRLAS